MATGVSQPASVSDAALEAIETAVFVAFGCRRHCAKAETQRAVYCDEPDKTAVFDGRFAGMLEQEQRP